MFTNFTVFPASAKKATDSSLVAKKPRKTSPTGERVKKGEGRSKG
jgi:hypothetical protein